MNIKSLNSEALRLAGMAVLCCAMVSCAASAPVAKADTLGPNLITNSSFETVGGGGLPSGWKEGGYGTNTRTYNYPVAGTTGKAAQVTVTNYTSGDAKWYFNNISVTPGQKYQFSDYYKSTVATEVDIEYTMSNGSKTYDVIGTPGASSTYANFTAQFTVPANAVSLTIFHLIHQNGTISGDDYSLNLVSSSDSGGGGTTPPTNLVANGSLETVGANGGPNKWLTGSWGTNTASFVYPTTGVNGTKGVQVSISSYTSGDAKWYFTPIVLGAGIYTYTDSYKSTVPTTVTIQYHNADGSYTYQDLGTDPASPNAFKIQNIGFVVPSGVKDVTIFHLINSVGTLTLDNITIAANKVTSGVFQNGAVTLTFDNGWLSQYQDAIPKMDTYGYKGTFYIITHELSDFGYTGFVSKAQIQNMAADGQEIGSHTKTHPDLTTLSQAQAKDEITGARQELLAMNVGPINSFAYPFGDYNSSTVALVKQAGYTNARTTNLGYTVPTSDPYQFPRYLIQADTTPAQVEQWIDQAIASKSWLILEFHQIDASGDTYSMTPANFGQIVDYLHQKGIMVVTMEQGMGSF